jgi:hypothetical protein
MADQKIGSDLVRVIGIVCLGLLATGVQANAANSLCAPNEEVFFNCPIKDSPKLLSVCGRAGEEARRGAPLPGDYLQYRFGPHDKPELLFPNAREASLDKFWVAHEYIPSAFYESHQLSFRSGAAEYRVYAVSQPADEGPNAPPDIYGGVIVSTAGGRDINIPCGAVPEDDLGDLVRKFGVGYREGQAEPDGVIRASFQLCQAIPRNSSASDFKAGVSDNVLNPLNDAFMLGLHDTPDVVALKDGAVERLVAKPVHGKLVRHRRTLDLQLTWRYTPNPGFIGNDRVEFEVQGKEKTGDAVEFHLFYKLRMEPESLRVYLPRPGSPVHPVRDMYCLIPSILLNYVEPQ